jgi:hypothetical protein
MKKLWAINVNTAAESPKKLMGMPIGSHWFRRQDESLERVIH